MQRARFIFQAPLGGPALVRRRPTPRVVGWDGKPPGRAGMALARLRENGHADGSNDPSLPRAHNNDEPLILQDRDPSSLLLRAGTPTPRTGKPHGFPCSGGLFRLRRRYFRRTMGKHGRGSSTACPFGSHLGPHAHRPAPRYSRCPPRAGFESRLPHLLLRSLRQPECRLPSRKRRRFGRCR